MSPRNVTLLHILDVEICVFVHLSVTPSLDLPESGQAGLDRVTGVLPRLVLGDDALQLRTGSDDAQRALEHVVELRELVEAPLAECLTDRREPGVVGVLVGDPAIVAVELAHPAHASRSGCIVRNLWSTKRSPSLPTRCWRSNDRPTEALHHDADDGEDRGEHDEQHQRQDAVDGGLDEPFVCGRTPSDGEVGRGASARVRILNSTGHNDIGCSAE